MRLRVKGIIAMATWWEPAAIHSGIATLTRGSDSFATFTLSAWRHWQMGLHNRIVFPGRLCTCMLISLNMMHLRMLIGPIASMVAT